MSNINSIDNLPRYDNRLSPPSLRPKISRLTGSIEKDLKFQDYAFVFGGLVSILVTRQAKGIANHTVKFLRSTERLFFVKLNASRFPMIFPVVSRLRNIEILSSTAKKVTESSKKIRDRLIADEKKWEKFWKGEGSMITGILAGSALSIAFGDRKIKEYQAKEKTNEVTQELKTMANELKLVLNDELQKRTDSIKEKLTEADAAIAQLPPKQREDLEREKNKTMEEFSEKITDFSRQINEVIEKIDEIPLRDVESRAEENQVLCLKCVEPVVLIALTLISNRWSLAQKIYQTMQTSFPFLPERFAEKVIGGVIVVIAHESFKILNELDIRPDQANKIAEKMFEQMGLRREEIPQIESSDIHNSAIKVLTGAAGKLVGWAASNPVTGRLFKGTLDRTLKALDGEKYIERPLMRDEFNLLFDEGKKVIINLMKELEVEIRTTGEGKEEREVLEKITTAAKAKMAAMHDQRAPTLNTNDRVSPIFPFPNRGYHHIRPLAG